MKNCIRFLTLSYFLLFSFLQGRRKGRASKLKKVEVMSITIGVRHVVHISIGNKREGCGLHKPGRTFQLFIRFVSVLLIALVYMRSK